jgi:hypothetical protein
MLTLLIKGNHYSAIIYWTKCPWVSHFFKKSDFHLLNCVFPIFCYEISATALAGKFRVARRTCDTKIEVIECQFPLYISPLCLHLVGRWRHPSSIWEPRCDLRSPLTKKLDWSVKTGGRECNLNRLCIHFNKNVNFKLSLA